jgi:DNA-binding beta-propeller fold protein YncE
MHEIAIGGVFAGHRIDAVAGRGGMGVVYRATQLDLDRTVALKVIAPGLLTDDAIRRRFLRESRVAASLEHPNVIPIHYAGELDGIAYIVMRYVAGDDLRQLTLRAGGLPAERAATLVRQVGAALDAAHAAGLVHRDVKPANVLVAAGDHAYLTDFGLTKHAVSVGGETGTGRMVGTLDYAAPEQIRGDPVDARTDVYALGCLLFFVLTGRTPFPAEGHQAKMWAHLTEPPPAVSADRPDVPPALDRVVSRALAKDPDERYRSAGDVGRAALAAAAGEEATVTDERTVATGEAAPTHAAPATVAAPAPLVAADERPRRRRALAVGALLALVAAGVGLAFVPRGGHGGSVTTRTPTPTPASLPQEIRVLTRPNAVAVAGGRVWVGGASQRRLMAVDESARQVLEGVAPPVGVGVSDMAAGAAALWVAVAREQHVVRVDPRTGRVVGKPIAVNGTPLAVAAGPRDVWVGVRDPGPGPDGKLVRIDPRRGRVTDTVPVTAGIKNMVVTDSAVWVLSARPSRVVRFEPTSRRRTPTRLGGREATGLAYGGGALWATVPDLDLVVRVDERSLAVAAIAVGDGPAGVAVLGGDVWVANEGDSTLSRVDLVSRRAAQERLRVPLNPFGVVAADGRLWVTCIGDSVLQEVPAGFRAPAA